MDTRKQVSFDLTDPTATSSPDTPRKSITATTSQQILRKKVSFDLPDPTTITDHTKTMSEQAPQQSHNFDLLSSVLFTPIHSKPLPIKQRPASTFIIGKKLIGTATSFHDIFQASKSNSTPRAASTASTFFFKSNQANSPYMPELEAFCAGCYLYLVPEYVPQSTRAVYDYDKDGSSIHYTAVSSKALHDFKSTKEVQLKDSDLMLSILDKGITIEELDRFNNKLKHDTTFNQRDDADTLATLYTSDDKGVTISVGDLRRFRIMKGLASGLIASYLFEEDDLHRGNMSLQGDRIDFDGSWWSILSMFKSSSYLDSYFRSRNASQRFIINVEDIRNFPNLTHASPYYWPTRPTTLSSTVAKIVSSNPWDDKENKIYQSLATNPVFNYFKFHTLLKFILSGPDIYQHIAEMHIRPEINHDGKSLIDLLSEHLRDRLTQVQNILVTMPEFAQFIKNHGTSAFNTIYTEVEEHNTHYKNKSNKIDAAIRELDGKKPDEIRNQAKKLHLKFHPTDADTCIKEQIITLLIHKKESYQRQLIDLKNIKAKHADIISAVQTTSHEVESQPTYTFVEELEVKMRADSITTSSACHVSCST